MNNVSEDGELCKDDSSSIEENLMEPDINLVTSEKHELIQVKIEQNQGIQEVRDIVACELKKISADSVSDLTPLINTDIAFRIDFIDPQQKPIKCKCRPLPYNLKEKVKTELDQLLAAGIIRKSNSQWCSQLRVVDKPDGTIRLTVDHFKDKYSQKKYSLILNSILFIIFYMHFLLNSYFNFTYRIDDQQSTFIFDKRRFEKNF